MYSNNDNKVGDKSQKFILRKDASMRRPVYVPVITNAVAYNDTAILLSWKVIIPKPCCYLKSGVSNNYTLIFMYTYLSLQNMRTESNELEGYFIYYRESTSAGSYSKVTVPGKDEDSYYICHLTSGIMYDIKIQSFNQAGVSNFSAIVSAKTLGKLG